MALRALAALMLAASCLVLFTASPSHACSCAPGAASAAVREASAIFRGTLDDERRGPKDSSSLTPARVLTFDVDRVWKGKVASSTEVGSRPVGGVCGLQVDEGQSLLVFAIADENGGLTSNICASGGATQEDVERLLGPGEAPDAPVAAGSDPGFGWGWAELAGVAVLLGLVGAGAYVVARMRRRSASG